MLVWYVTPARQTAARPWYTTLPGVDLTLMVTVLPSVNPAVGVAVAT